MRAIRVALSKKERLREVEHSLERDAAEYGLSEEDRAFLKDTYTEWMKEAELELAGARNEILLKRNRLCEDRTLKRDELERLEQRFKRRELSPDRFEKRSFKLNRRCERLSEKIEELDALLVAEKASEAGGRTYVELPNPSLIEEMFPEAKGWPAPGGWIWDSFLEAWNSASILSIGVAFCVGAFIMTVSLLVGGRLGGGWLWVGLSKGVFLWLGCGVLGSALASHLAWRKRHGMDISLVQSWTYFKKEGLQVVQAFLAVCVIWFFCQSALTSLLLVGKIPHLGPLAVAFLSLPVILGSLFLFFLGVQFVAFLPTMMGSEGMGWEEGLLLVARTVRGTYTRGCLGHLLLLGGTFFLGGSLLLVASVGLVGFWQVEKALLGPQAQELLRATCPALNGQHPSFFMNLAGATQMGSLLALFSLVWTFPASFLVHTQLRLLSFGGKRREQQA